MFPYDTTSEPALPVVRIRITDQWLGAVLPVFVAVIDSGADLSCVPRSILPGTGPWSYDRVRVGYVGHAPREERSLIRIPEARVEFLDRRGVARLTKRCQNVRLIAHEEGVLGRDILNQLLCELDGPGLRTRLR